MAVNAAINYRCARRQGRRRPLPRARIAKEHHPADVVRQLCVCVKHHRPQWVQARHVKQALVAAAAPGQQQIQRQRKQQRQPQQQGKSNQ
jgi:hypothetical protein